MPGVKDSLFGMLAVRAGYVTEEQVQDCMDVQQQYQKQGGKVPRLGEILAQKGYMKSEQVSAILDGQHREKGGLFGEIAIQWKFITREQLDECLLQQSEDDAKDLQRRRIGEIMLYKGYLQVHQIAAVLEAQKRRVIQCSGCSKYINTAGFRPSDKLKCASCGVITEVPAMAGFTFTDFRPQEAEVTPSDTAEAAREGSSAGSGVRVAAGGEPAKKAEQHPLEIGGYEIIARMGQDATGTTVKARHVATDTTVVLKVMKVTPMQDGAFLKRFIEEGKRGTKLIHKYIKRVYEVGLDRGRYYYSAEYVKGRSLKRFLDEGKRFTALEAVDIMLKVAEALSYAHKNGVIHGDLRPSNIILSDGGDVKITEIGIAKDIAGNLRYFARSSKAVPFYVAPELVVDDSNPSGACDVYSLGAILYHLVAARPPFEGENPLEVLMRISEGSAPTPYRLGVATEGLSRVIMKTIAPEPSERYATVDEAVAELKDHLRDAALSTTRARKHDAAQKAASPRTTRSVDSGKGRISRRTSIMKQKSSAVWWVVVILLLLAAGAVAGYFYYRENYGELSWKRDLDAQFSATHPEADVEQETVPAKPDDLAFQEAQAYASANPDDHRGACERFNAFLGGYPNSLNAPLARKEAARYSNLAARQELPQMLSRRDECLSQDDYLGALRLMDAWLDECSDAPERSRVVRMRASLLLDEQNFLARARSKARMLVENEDPAALDAIRQYCPTKLMAAKKEEALAALEKLLADSALEEEPPAPAEPPAPVELAVSPEPEDTAAVDTALDEAAGEETRELTARLSKALSSFDMDAVEEISLIRTGHRQASYIPEEAGQLAAFLDVLFSRVAGQSRKLTVTYHGSRQTIVSADRNSVVIRLTAGATKSDMQVPWGQLQHNTLWEILNPLIKKDKDEAVKLGLVFCYLEQPGYARTAWARAHSMGADIRPYLDRFSAPGQPDEELPVEAPSSDAKPEKAADVVPRRILFKGSGVKNYLKNTSGVWLPGTDSMTVSSTARAELPAGDVKGFLVRFKPREAAAKALFTLGPWKMGVDGKNGRLIVQSTDGVEKRLPQIISAGKECTLQVEVTGKDTIYTLNGRVVERDGNRKSQSGSLVIEVEGSLGIDLIEVQFME